MLQAEKRPQVDQQREGTHLQYRSHRFWWLRWAGQERSLAEIRMYRTCRYNRWYFRSRLHLCPQKEKRICAYAPTLAITKISSGWGGAFQRIKRQVVCGLIEGNREGSASSIEQEISVDLGRKGEESEKNAQFLDDRLSGHPDQPNVSLVARSPNTNLLLHQISKILIHILPYHPIPNSAKAAQWKKFAIIASYPQSLKFKLADDRSKIILVILALLLLFILFSGFVQNEKGVVFAYTSLFHYTGLVLISCTFDA